MLPAAPMKPYFRYIALGGLGEVGMNCTLMEANGRLIVFDCGVTFPNGDHYGVDLIIPDFGNLAPLADRIDAIVITHGHMDHIGAIPFLLSEVDAPIYAPKFAMELLKGRLEEHDLLDTAELHVTRPGQETLDLGAFKLDFIHINHSIPHAMSVVIHTDAGTFVHTGDFKFDRTPVGEAVADFAALRAVGVRGVRALFSDSTNILQPGTTGSETSVGKSLLAHTRSAEQTVFIAMFSTNLWRVQAAINIALETGRSLIVLGRSLQRSVQLGRDLGILKIPGDNPFVTERRGLSLPREQRLVICTGSQGEPRAALTRMAVGSFPRYKVEEGDRVIFSSRIIPGNETTVLRVLDLLARVGAEVVLGKAGVHVSGHAHRDEQAEMIQLIRPQTFVPVHGTFRFQTAHAELAASLGVRESLVIDNGDVLEFCGDSAKVVGQIEASRWVVDNHYAFGDLNGPAIRDRKRLARLGLVIIWMVVDADSGHVEHGPVVINRGAMEPDEWGRDFLDDVSAEARSAIEKLQLPLDGPEDVSRSVSQAVRRFFRREVNRKPHVEAITYLV